MKLAGIGKVVANGAENAVGESLARCHDVSVWFAKIGLARDQANVLAEGMRRGGAVVLVRPPRGQERAVHRLLQSTGCVNLTGRRADYLKDGWRGFDPGQRTLDERQLKRERLNRLRHRQPLVTPVISRDRIAP